MVRSKVSRATAMRAYRKRKAYRKRSQIPLSVKPYRPMIRVQRTFWLQNWTPTTTTTNDFWRYFTVRLADIPNVTEYTNLFDMYRITSLKWTFRPRYDSFAGNDTTDTTLPGVTNQAGVHLHAVIDPRSGITPTGTYTSGTLNAFLENGKVRSYNGNKAVNLIIKYPCIADDVNATSNSKFIRAPYISCNQNSVAHRGVHVFLQDINLTGTFGQSFDVFCTVNMTLKGQR